MFGNLGAYANGNMFMGLFGPDIGIKLPDADRATLQAKPGTGPFGPEERPMGGYVTLPTAWSLKQARPWIAKAYTNAASLYVSVKRDTMPGLVSPMMRVHAR